jgi:ABC-type antimicrobial peptide transport system permease subunit
VLSYAVTQRTREIGIRMSLGASRGSVLGRLLGDGMRLAAVGLALGLVGAFAVSRIVETLLAEAKPRDPAIYAGAAVFLALAALLSCWAPARRAARMDPLEALRYE